MITVNTYGLINYSCILKNYLIVIFPHNSINLINKAILTKTKGIKADMMSPICEDHTKSKILANVNIVR